MIIVEARSCISINSFSKKFWKIFIQNLTFGYLKVVFSKYFRYICLYRNGGEYAIMYSTSIFIEIN